MILGVLEGVFLPSHRIWGWWHKEWKFATLIHTKDLSWVFPTSNTLGKRAHSNGIIWFWQLSWSSATFFPSMNVADISTTWSSPQKRPVVSEDKVEDTLSLPVCLGMSLHASCLTSQQVTAPRSSLEKPTELDDVEAGFLPRPLARCGHSWRWVYKPVCNSYVNRRDSGDVRGISTSRFSASLTFQRAGDRHLQFFHSNRPTFLELLLEGTHLELNAWDKILQQCHVVKKFPPKQCWQRRKNQKVSCYILDPGLLDSAG